MKKLLLSLMLIQIITLAHGQEILRKNENVKELIISNKKIGDKKKNGKKIIYEYVALKDNTVSTINLYDIKSNIISFSGNKIIKYLYLDNVKCNYFECFGNKFSVDDKDKQTVNYISFTNSTIKESFIWDNIGKIFNIYFAKDSLSGVVGFAHDDKGIINSNESNFVVRFLESYINGQIIVDDRYGVREIILKECTFGPNASITDAPCDISFQDCSVNSRKISLSFLLQNEHHTVSIGQADINNISFINYPENISLKFLKDTLSDENLSIYKALLSRFKDEGRVDAYKNLDIEYRNFVASHSGLTGKFFNYISKIWWNYGYAQGRVFKWTTWIFIFCYLFNWIFWNRMNAVYPIIAPNAFSDNTNRSWLEYILRKPINIFIFTSMIFFSLKVEFEKLILTDTLFNIIFLIQYVLGVGCILFVVKYVLSI